MRYIDRIGILAIIVTIAVVIWAASFQGTAQDKASLAPGNSCNTFNLAGTYAFSAFGTIHPDHPLGYPAGPYSSAGFVKLHQDGTYEVNAKTSLNGTFTDENYTGDYTFDENCTVTLTYSEFPITVNYTSEDRNDTYGIVVVPKTNITIIGSRK